METSAADIKKSKIFSAVALVAAYLTFWRFGLLVFLFPGLLAKAQRELSARRVLLLGAVWGCAFAACFYFWAISYGLLAWLALVLVRGLPWMLLAVLSLLLRRYPKLHGFLSEAIATAVGLTLVTQVHLSGLSGADWETPMGGLAAWPVALATLPWLGLVGGAFLIGFISHLLCAARKKDILLGLVTLVCWQVINASLYYSEPVASSEDSLMVGLIQTGWEQGAKWDEENVRRAKQRLIDLTEEAVSRGAQLVVWPETSWPVRGFRRRPSDTRLIGRLARKLQVDILASSIEEVPEGWYNSVSQIESTGRIGLEYRKQRLAPFAEYLPLPSGWEAHLRKRAPFDRISRYLPGSENLIFQTAGHRYTVLICYESMISDSSRMGTDEIDFLVVATNDAPFVSSFAQEAHFRSAILRAAEFRKPVLQAANTGVTGMVDPKGRVVGRTVPGFSGALVQMHALVKP